MKNNNNISNIVPTNRYIQGKAKVIFLTILATLFCLALAGVAGKDYLKALLLPTSAANEVVAESPKYLALDKFVISVESEEVIYYMMVEMSLATSSDENLVDLNHYLPVIRNAFVTNLSQRDFTTMRDYLKNLNLLQSELLEELKKVLTKHDMANAVNDVLITKLVIQ